MPQAHKKWKSRLFFTLGILSILFVFMAMRPYPVPTEDNCFQVIGITEALSEGVSKDVVITLEEDDHYYYINRGLERGVDLDEWKDLTGQEMVVTVMKHWTPLDPFNKMRKVVSVKSGEEVLFSELTINN